MPLLSPAELQALPQTFAASAGAGLDLSTDTGRDAARIRMAADLVRCLKAPTLRRACRANGLPFVRTGSAAARALATLAIPFTSTKEQLR